MLIVQIAAFVRYRNEKSQEQGSVSFFIVCNRFSFASVLKWSQVTIIWMTMQKYLYDFFHIFLKIDMQALSNPTTITTLP